MATPSPKSQMIQHGVLQTVWLLGDADVGLPEELSRYPYHSVEIVGTFTGPPTVLLEGSDEDGGAGTYFTLKDVSGTNISATAAARFDTLAIVPRYMRAKSSGGSSSSTKLIITSRMNFGR